MTNYVALLETSNYETCLNKYGMTTLEIKRLMGDWVELF